MSRIYEEVNSMPRRDETGPIGARTTVQGMYMEARKG